MQHLQPIPGYIDKSFIDRAKKKWDLVCDEAYASYTNLAENLVKSAEQTRDPFERILPILNWEKPLEAMKIFAKNIWEDMPHTSVAPRLAATQRRDHLIIKITGLTALRSKNIRQLLLGEELRLEDGQWVIEISWKKFKNKKSSFFGRREKHNYRKVLPDVDGLYEQIDAYVRLHRPVLLAGRTSNIFFVSTGKRTLFTNRSFFTLYRRLTGQSHSKGAAP